MDRSGCLVAVATARGVVTARADALATAALATAVLAVVALAGCTTQPLPEGPSDSDIAEYYAASSDARWQSMAFDPAVERPVVVDVQPVSLELWASRIADCMNSAGYQAYSEQGGGLSITATDSTAGTVVQSTEEKLALYACQELYPIESDATGVLSTPQLQYIYRYYVRFLLPCLESRGYDVGDVPPADAFVEQGNFGVWSPYWGDITRDTDVLAALQFECPPMPPGIDDPYS
jgi:hypothetical protein